MEEFRKLPVGMWVVWLLDFVIKGMNFINKKLWIYDESTVFCCVMELGLIKLTRHNIIVHNVKMI